MSLLDSLGDLMKQVTTGNAPAADVDAAYDRVARAVPNETLADGLSHAFKSDETPPFEQIVSGRFDKSTPEQKVGFFNHLLIVGLVGALVGGFLMGFVGLRPEGGFLYTIVVAFIGAVVVTWIFRKLTATKG